MERNVKIFMHGSPEISCYSSILKTRTDTLQLQHVIFHSKFIPSKNKCMVQTAMAETSHFG